MNRLQVLAILAILWTFGSTVAWAASVREDWNNGTLGGWEANTIQATVEVMTAGGVDDSPFLYSYETALPSTFNLVGVVQHVAPYTGNYSGYDYAHVQCDLQFIHGLFLRAMFRIRYLDASYNDWYVVLTWNTPPGMWNTYSVDFDPNWTDAEAMAAGWVQDPPAPSFRETMAQVYAAEIRVEGYDGVDLAVGIDNFVLESRTVDATAGTWGGIKALFHL